MRWLHRSDALVAFDGGSLLIRARGTERAVRLNETATDIWDAFEYPENLDEVTAGLACRYDGDAADIRADVEQLIESWLECGLLQPAEPPSDAERLRHRYLWLLKRSLAGLTDPDNALRIAALKRGHVPGTGVQRERWLRDIRRHQPREGATLEASARIGQVLDHAPLIFSQTIIGLSGLGNIERCSEAVFADRIAGDFLEAGVLAGGAAIFMRALQHCFGEASRRVWLADSFQGVPSPTATPDVEAGLDLSEPRLPWICRSLDDVKMNFARHGVLDAGVRFLPGWFADTLPAAPIGQLALLRIDADLYGSTMDVLRALYGRVSPGGFLIIDDYHVFEPCRRAVDEFRAAHAIDATLVSVDANRVYWRVPA